MNTLKVTMLLILFSASHQQIPSPEENVQCGQYGFRCVDTESFQICSYVDLDGQTEAPEIVRKCLDHNICDEDNPAYCTPLERIGNEITSAPVEKKVLNKRSRGGTFSQKLHSPINNDISERKDLNLRRSDDDNPFGFNNDEIETTTVTSADNDDYPVFKNQQFECETYGYFPDIYNASMFWHCDHQVKGKGYVVRHMLCSPGRVFNPVHKECVMIGTTRNTRDYLDRDRVTFKKKRRPFKNVEPEWKLNYKFSCRNRLPGKYSDKANCRLYHYCLPRTYAPFNELTFLCPDRLAYDDVKETCNRISFERCMAKLHPREYKILYIQVDAIVLQKQKCKVDLRRHSPDCSEYHLCYNDEVVHLKCPDSYRFDENLLTCQPQHLVSCEY